MVCTKEGTGEDCFSLRVLELRSIIGTASVEVGIDVCASAEYLWHHQLFGKFTCGYWVPREAIQLFTHPKTIQMTNFRFYFIGPSCNSFQSLTSTI